jgi:enolase-phosphatase E1
VSRAQADPDPGGVLTAFPKVVLLDIEGTTTPIDFVTQVLFPFARERMGSLLAVQWSDPAIREDVAQLRGEASGVLDDPGSVARHALSLMDQDRKSTGLKALQGRIWEAGYAQGLLRGVVYDDVPRAFERWKRRGVRIAIFSSGSVLAQKLLFGHSTAGDLGREISDYFDTTTGPKREAESYRRIASALAVPPADVLFYSDVVAELEAARAAGMQTALSVRDGKVLVDAGGHRVIRDFDGECAA